MSNFGTLVFKDALDRNTWIGVSLTIIAGIVVSFGEGTSGIISGLLITSSSTTYEHPHDPDLHHRHGPWIVDMKYFELGIRSW